MKNRLRLCIKFLFQLWICLATASVHALVLGDMQVQSFLGQPLNAKIAFADLSDADATKLKLRLAGTDEYRKLGLQYPESAGFNFHVVDEQGALLPFIRISTPHALEEPFINLLIEVSSPTGKLIKAYTVLLDPLPETAVENEAATVGETQFQRSASFQTKQAIKSVKIAKKRKPRRETMLAESVVAHTHMKLAMSLSISSYDPAADAGANRDALQEELIAKEKSLEELKLQIGEMQTVIKSLQDKQNIAVPVESQVPVVAMPVVEQPAPLLVKEMAKPKAFRAWLNPALAITALLLALTGFILYRKYKRVQELGPFDDLHEETAQETPQPVESAADQLRSDAADDRAIVSDARVPFTFQAESDSETHTEAAPAPALQYEKVSVGEQSVKTPAYTEPIVPPEYAILMEANQFMRAGDDDRAEDALLKAIEINPKNLYGYQALLRIFEKRGDVGAFENTARQLKAIADDDTFGEVAEIGRLLDPENPLYLPSQN